MRTVLIPIDNGLQTEHGIRSVVAQARADDIHLLNVQAPVSGYASRFVNSDVIRDYQRDEGERILSGARRALDRTGQPYTAHIRVGEAASTIASVADELRANEIVVGAEGGVLSSFLTWLLVARIRRYAKVPVVMVMAPRTAPSVGKLAGAGTIYPR